MWRWYFEMDDAFGSKDSISPSVLYASSSMDQPSASPLSPASMSSACLNSSGTPERCTSTEILDLLKEHVTKEEHCSHAENGSEAVVTPQDFAHCSQLELKNIEESNTGTVKEAAHKFLIASSTMEQQTPPSPGSAASSSSACHSSSPELPRRTPKKRRRSSNEILDFLKEQAEKEDKREAEAQKRVDRFLELFTKLIDKM
ncbi:UNVERIFIED_CONTAM: hypothetical protein FKN15_053734 [Acipenser sinensis]